MSIEVAILIATAVLAVVAVTAAIVAVRAVRQLRASADRVAREDAGRVPRGTSGVSRPRAAHRDHQQSRDLDTRPRSSAALDHREVAEPEVEVVRVVEGRVIVQPTQEQVVAATLTRPSVRFGILVTGIVHALRPESRDRITALMRREYRGRRRARQQAARAAARATNGPPPDTHRGWVGS